MTVETERLIYTDLKVNNNKYWNAELNGTTVSCNWGRVGVDRGQSKTFTFVSEDAAKKAFETKIREKLRKGYTKQRTLGDKAPVSVAYVAKVQIDHSKDTETTQLIDFLIKRNIHAIEGMTSIRLEAGKLTTPLGPVTGDGLDEAEILLGKMLKTKSDNELGDLANLYLRIVPRDIGRRKIDPASLFGTKQQLEIEQTTLDSLRAVIKDLDDKQTAAAKDVPPVFETKLEIVKLDESDFDRINRMFSGSVNRSHTSSRYKLARVWRMSIAAMDKGFEAKLGNVKELWHGTKDANLLSILKNGFIIPKRNQGIQIAGRMFGDGVYFSDQSTKSLNYTTAYWGGTSSTRPFMLLNDVAMGKEYMPTRSFSGTIPPGYDSCFAKGGQAGILNNEMIVYRTSQINPKYLCEFK